MHSCIPTQTSPLQTRISAALSSPVARPHHLTYIQFYPPFPLHPCLLPSNLYPTEKVTEAACLCCIHLSFCTEEYSFRRLLVFQRLIAQAKDSQLQFAYIDALERGTIMDERSHLLSEAAAQIQKHAFRPRLLEYVQDALV